MTCVSAAPAVKINKPELPLECISIGALVKHELSVQSQMFIYLADCRMDIM